MFLAVSQSVSQGAVFGSFSNSQSITTDQTPEGAVGYPSARAFEVFLTVSQLALVLDRGA